MRSTVQSDNRELELRIYPGADGRFSLYEDDGTSYDYERGDCAWIDFAWEDARKILRISAPRGRYTGITQPKRLRIILSQPGGEGTAREVTYEGRRVTVRF